MKTPNALFLVLMLTVFSQTVFATAVDYKIKPVAPVKVVTTQYPNLFVFKVDREFKGATIEVYYSNGDLVYTKSLAKRKMIINFCDLKAGTYKIKITKDHHTEEFQYIKK